MHIIVMHVIASGNTPFYKTLPFGIGISIVGGVVLSNIGSKKNKRGS